jgi:hypothetical protein
VYAGEDSLRAFLTLLRPLYLHDELSGFEQVRLLARRHAEAKRTADSKKVIEAIDSHGRGLRRVKRDSSGIDIIEQDDQGERKVRPGEVFEDFLYGRYFHLDDAKVERLRLLWAEVDPIYQEQFIATALRFAQVYGSFAGIPNAILREPSLLLLSGRTTRCES